MAALKALNGCAEGSQWLLNGYAEGSRWPR